MWLKKLTLKNFQKHESLVLDFTPGVNILYGQSDAGKSCVRRAIGFLFFNDPRTDDVIRKEGSKMTSVIGLLDNDTEVERTKSASVNRYVIRRPGLKDMVYDSIGAEIPQEVQQVLQMNVLEIDKYCLNLNIAEQISLPFLTGSDFPASARLKLFNKLTGNDLLDVVVQSLNKEIVGARRNITAEENIIKTNQPEIGKLETSIQEKKKILDEVRGRLDVLGIRHENLAILKTLHSEYTAAKEKLTILETRKANIRFIDESLIASLKERCGKLNEMRDLKEDYDHLKTKLVNLENQRKSIKTVDTDFTALKERVQQLNEVKQSVKSLRELESKLARLQEHRSKALAESDQAQQEYKALLKEAGVCPTCRAVMTEEHIAHVKI